MKKRLFLSTFALFLTLIPVLGAQESQFRGMMDRHNEEFLDQDPKIGAPLPAVTAYDESKTAVPLTDLKGSYTVLVYGCLT